MITIKHFLNRPAEIVAPQLLGCILEREIDGNKLRVRIVETEAYDQSDEASHSYKGRTNRNEVMFTEAGHLYVYLTYGMHYCCNVVTGDEGEGAAVLIRAAEPILGLEHMEMLRSKRGKDLLNGPAKLCQALAIDKSLNGHNLADLPLRLIIQEPIKFSMVNKTERIGISRAKGKLWRFYIVDNKYVSKS